jgi:hypothetical protein
LEEVIIVNNDYIDINIFFSLSIGILIQRKLLSITIFLIFLIYGSAIIQSLHQLFPLLFFDSNIKTKKLFLLFINSSNLIE